MKAFRGPIGHIFGTAAIGVFLTWLATPHGMVWVTVVWLVVPTVTLVVYAKMNAYGNRDKGASGEDIR